MDVKHIFNESKGAFIIKNDTERLAEMTYSKAGQNKIIIDHTEIDDSLRGQGAGNKLLMEAVNYARVEKLKIIPLCPFAKSVFDKDPSISDVLA